MFHLALLFHLAVIQCLYGLQGFCVTGIFILNKQVFPKTFFDSATSSLQDRASNSPTEKGVGSSTARDVMSGGVNSSRHAVHLTVSLVMAS